MAKIKLTKKTVVRKAKKFTKVFKSIKRRYVFYFLGSLAFFLVLYLGRSLVLAAWVGNRPIFRVSVISELEKQGGSQVLDDLINKSLIEQETRKQGLKISDDQINAEMAKIKDALKSQGTSLESVLSFQGMTKEGLKKQIKTQLMIEGILKDKIASSDGTIDQKKLAGEYRKWISDLRKKAKILRLVRY